MNLKIDFLNIKLRLIMEVFVGNKDSSTEVLTCLQLFALLHNACIASHSQCMYKNKQQHCMNRSMVAPFYVLI